jgi:CRP-like cAMP-binding protein
MLPLRLVAIASNVAFMIYGMGAGLVPIFVLHATLLPLNIYWSVQRLNEIKSIKKSVEGRTDINVLIPYMTRRRLSKGTTLFRKGDIADAIFFLASGKLLIPELDKTLRCGTLVGEMGVFRPEKERTASVICLTDCEFYAISESDVQDLCLENPQFGLFLTKLIASRLIAENAPSSDGHLQTTSL